MLLVGFIIRIYHDARSSECQMSMLYLSPLCLHCMVQNELYLLVVIVSLDYSDFRRNFKVGIQKIIFTFGHR